MKKTRLIIEAIRDLFWPLSPQWLFQRDHEEPVFAFLVHPRDLSDVYRKYPQLRVLPPRSLEWFLGHFWPVVLSEVEGLKSARAGKPVRGWILSIPLTAEQMLAKRQKSVRLIRRAIKLAYCRGANIIGLGALNASVTYRGRDIKDVIERLNMGVTSGVGYTACNITEMALGLISYFGLSVTGKIFGIVGAAGGVGSAVVRYLLTKGARNFILIDLDRKHSRINELTRDFKNIYPQANFQMTSQLKELKRANIVITATNAPEALIKSEHLSPGTILIDDAQPSDIDPEVIERREDILSVEGGAIEVPGIVTNFNFGLKHSTDVFSCLAEVMILAAHHRTREQSFDFVTPEQINELAQGGEALGFRQAEYQNFRRVYTQEDLGRFKKRFFS